MQIKLFKQQYVYITGLLLLVTGLPLSYFLTSLSQFFLGLSFFAEGSSKEKWKRFFSNRLALLLAGIWILHLIGLMWTQNFADGIQDLKIKLPLLILPIIIGGTKPLQRKHFNLILLAFVSAVFIASCVIFAVLMGWIYRPYHDIHEIFIFKISHIRFALFVCLSVFILFDLAFRKYPTAINRLAALAIIIWFIFFQIKVEAVTGLVISFITVLILLFSKMFNHPKNAIRLGFAILLSVLVIGAAFWIQQLNKEINLRKPFSLNENDTTALGAKYTFDLNDSKYENGYKLNLYVARDELHQAWNKRSKIEFDSLDARNQKVNATLIRFLTSKGLRKDADGLSRLSDEEVKAIESGIANVEYMHPGFKTRVKQILWEIQEYHAGNNPSGHSVTQRLEFWRAASHIIRKNYLFGTGTGDLKQAYAEEYDAMHSQLDAAHRLRAHNQYLSIFAAFGIFGFIYFVSVWITAVRMNKRRFLFSVFMIILLLSMLTEDTLETQPGATFAALFYCLFLFAVNGKNDEWPAQLPKEESH